MAYMTNVVETILAGLEAQKAPSQVITLVLKALQEQNFSITRYNLVEIVKTTIQKWLSLDKNKDRTAYELAQIIDYLHSEPIDCAEVLDLLHYSVHFSNQDLADTLTFLLNQNGWLTANVAEILWILQKYFHWEPNLIERIIRCFNQGTKEVILGILQERQKSVLEVLIPEPFAEEIPE